MTSSVQQRIERRNRGIVATLRVLKAKKEDKANDTRVLRTLRTALDICEKDDHAGLRADVMKALEELRQRKEKDSSNNPLTVLLRLRREIEILKSETFIREISRRLRRGRAVVVFVNFAWTFNIIANAFKEQGVKYGCIMGKQKDMVRTQTIDDFRRGKINLLLAMIRAGSDSISLHDTVGDRPRVSIISPTWSATQLRQVLGRVDRVGACSDSDRVVVFCSGTVERRIAETLNKKFTDMDALMTGKDKPLHDMLIN